MLSFRIDKTKLPLLITVDGESKSAKTTGTNAIRNALEDEGLNVYEADAGAFFRRMTVCVFEALGVADLDSSQEFTAEQIYDVLDEVIKTDAAFADRLWPNLQSCLVERYVSVVGNTPAAQRAMETWYDKLIEITQSRDIDILAINARNPRDRLRHWKSPVLDLLVYCSPEESAKRILYARGVREPSQGELDKQMSEVIRRRELDRNRDKYPYIDPSHTLECVLSDGIETSANLAVVESWKTSGNATDADLPMTIKLDTTVLTLVQTRQMIAALARDAINYAVAKGI